LVDLKGRPHGIEGADGKNRSNGYYMKWKRGYAFFSVAKERDE